MWVRRVAVLATAAALAAAGGAVSPAWAGGQGEPMYGDLNRDGVADRAVLTATGSGDCVVAVSLGRRGGGYQAATTHRYLNVPDGNCPDLGVAVDLGADRIVELVVGWFAGHPSTTRWDLLVLRDFRVSTGFTTTILQPSFIGLADFNGDGRQDVYEWTDQGDGFVTYLNTATGGLTPGPVKYCSGSPDLHLADLNRNGAMDVVIAYFEGCGAYFSGVVAVLDSGRVVDLEADAEGAATWTTSVSDVNADRIPDVVAVNRVTGRTDHFIGRGDGTFVPATRAVPDRITVAAARRTSLAVLANDYATTQAKLTIVTPPAYGRVEVTHSRTVVYVPGGAGAKSDRFVYRLTEYGRTSSAAVTLRMAP